VPSMATTAAPDEVDQVLKQYITPAVTAEPQQNFAADLNPIPAEPIEQPRVKEVTVKKGDVLERIARQNRVSVSELMKFNNLTGTRLKIGQVLKIPAKAQKAISETTTDAEYYTVKNGDNPWVIAVRHHMKVEELLQLNNMDEAKARRLKPGDRIRIK
jgi:peptidoglycan DL-endopeptidase LytF